MTVFCHQVSHFLYRLHQHRFRADTLLGVASVPLTPLLHDCWVDGYAPVYALLAAQGPQAAPEKIQVRG